MKDKAYQQKRRDLSRVRYAEKRRTPKWRSRKRSRKIVIRIRKIRKARQSIKPFLPHAAPTDFRLIENTDEVLEYFNNAEKRLRKGENINLNIAAIEKFSPETIALLVASLNDEDFLHQSVAVGNWPNDESLRRMMTGSGFYDHVHSKVKVVRDKENLMHREKHTKVVSEIAKTATIAGIKHVFHSGKPFDPLYNTLIECMSNTNNHANLSDQGKCFWWLFVYCHPEERRTSYTFLDLGVGIFGSAVVQDHVKTVLRKVGLYPNIRLVDDLLSGKIQSRITKDNILRGKGIPQIAKAAESEKFRSFYIIANDVKIDLKTRQKTQLKHALSGTLLHWELQC
jgi:hypothetical protein